MEVELCRHRHRSFPILPLGSREKKKKHSQSCSQEEEEDLAMAFDHVGGGDGDGDARGAVVTGASFGELLAVNEDLRGDRGGEQHGKLDVMADLLRDDARDDGFDASTQVLPQCDGGCGDRGDGNDDGLLLSADALLFMLEEEEDELLLLDGVDADAIDLAGLDFSDFSGSTDDSSEDQCDSLCNLEPTVSGGAIPPSRMDGKPQELPMKVSTSELRLPPPRARKLHAIKPATTLAIVGVQRKGSTSRTESTKKPNSSGGRKRVKDELEYLRQHVSDLEEQLRQLKLWQGDRSQSTRDPSSSSSSNSLSSTLWKRVASRQQDGRRKAEAENARLRDLLEAQLRLARSLARTLRKRPNLADVNPMGLTSEEKLRQLNPHTTREIYAHLEETIGPLYACADDVLRETGLSGATSTTTLKREIKESQVKMDACGRLFLEIVDSSIVPFDLQVTSRGFWKLFSHSKQDELRYGMCSLKAMELTSDTLRGEYSVSWPVQNTETLVYGHLLGKQITEENRVVYIRSSVGELKSSLFGSERVAVRETGWTVIEELPPSETGGSPSTIIQLIARMTPEVGESHIAAGDSFVSETQSSLVGVLTDLVLGAFQQNLDSMHEMVESMILMEMAQG